MTKPILLLLVLLTLLQCACKKESFIKNDQAQIAISADTLHFDTLFTTTGSITQAFKVFNRNDQKLLISEISLGNGNTSFFSINADGNEGPRVTDIEMAANDSLYVFVTVSIDPSSAKLPFIVQDSIKVAFNGNEKYVQLDAWGQNATFLRSGEISADTTWTNEKPFVILGGLHVNENARLTIEKGTKIYLHNNAPFLVDGILEAKGEKADSMEIVFNGDRLDDPYKDFPGSWPGIFFRASSRENMLTHVIVKNANQGIVVEGPSPDAGTKLFLNKCIIDNCFDAGLLAANTKVEAVNCLVSNCGRNVRLSNGGDYKLTNCTVVAYSNTLIAHKEPVLLVTNFDSEGNNLPVANLTAAFINCIFWGDNGTVDNEVAIFKEGPANLVADFQSCLWKLSDEPEGVTSSNMILNQDPLFRTIDSRNGVYDFRPKEDSPVLSAGATTGTDTDLDENPRNKDFPSIGAYEPTF